MKFTLSVFAFCSVIVMYGQSDKGKIRLDTPQSKVVTIPPEPVAPNGFDYGVMSKQGQTNEYRIGKVEDGLKEITERVDTLTGTVTGAKWAIAVAVPLFLGMVVLVLKFLGKHIATDLVAHYAKQQPASAVDLSVPPKS